MTADIRRDWLHQVVNACQVFAGHAVPRRTRSLRILFADFATQLPPPQSLVENVVLRGLLLELSLRWGHADHGAYHAEFPDAECTDDPAALAMAVWRNCSPNAINAFREWADAYITNMERIHPRYRASELRRDLDADFAQPLSLGMLAGRRGVSVRCLQRDFRELTGVTIQEYVTERRLDAAVRLLANTPDKVEWIANVVGWSSRKNLNRALARRRGVNPADIRHPAHGRMKTG
jgi:AraC-like DNA-binding protein